MTRLRIMRTKQDRGAWQAKSASHTRKPKQGRVAIPAPFCPTLCRYLPGYSRASLPALSCAIAIILFLFAASFPPAASTAHAQSASSNTPAFSDAPAPATSTAPLPQRVVSLNLCTDQLAASMLPAARLAGLSFNATDASLSLVSGVAAAFPALRGTIEELAHIQPDMVLLAEGQNPAMQQWLRQQDIPFVTLGYASSIAGVQQQAATLASALGNPIFARNLASRQNLLLAQTRLPAHAKRVAIYYPRGFTDGANTLIHDIITRMGGENIAAGQDAQGMGFLPLEKLVQLQPDLLIIPLYDYNVHSQAEELAQHPALAATGARQVLLPGQYLTCPHLGLEALINAIAAAARHEAG